MAIGIADAVPWIGELENACPSLKIGIERVELSDLCFSQQIEAYDPAPYWDGKFPVSLLGAVDETVNTGRKANNPRGGILQYGACLKDGKGSHAYISTNVSLRVCE
jgi:hypothetical protein